MKDPTARAGLLGDLEERWWRMRGRGRLRRALWLTGEMLSAARHYGIDRTPAGEPPPGAGSSRLPSGPGPFLDGL